MREQAFLEAGDEHRRKLQALGRVHGHHLQRVLAFTGLVLAGLQRRVRQERSERVHHGRIRGLAGREVDNGFVGIERGRRVDEFGQVLDPVGAFALRLVVRHKPALGDHVVHRLGQRQAARLGLHLFDDRAERRQRIACLAGGEAGDGGVERQVRGPGRILQRFHCPRADATRREVGDPQEGVVVLGVLHEAQVRQRVLDLGPLEEPQAAIDAIRNARREQGMFQHPRLRVRAVQDRHVLVARAIAREALDFLDDPARLVHVGLALEHADRLARAGRGPQVLAKAIGVVGDQRVGRVEDISVRAVVLLEADHLLDLEVPLEVGHVAHVRAAECIDRLVVVADREDRGLRPGQQLQPAVLQPVGVLELVDEDVAKAMRVVRAQELVSRQQLVAAQKQLGEVGHALALALRVVGGVDLDGTARLVVGGLHIACPLAFLLPAVDEPLHLARRETVVVDVHGLQQPLHHGELVGGIEDLEGLRQPRVAVMDPQHPVAQAVEGADPHAARVHRQHRGEARQHLARRLVRERDRKQPRRRNQPVLDQPGDARGEHACLPAAGPGKDERVLPVGNRDRRKLLGIEVFEVERQSARIIATAPSGARAARGIRL